MGDEKGLGYQKIIERVFHDRFDGGQTSIEFERADIVEAWHEEAPDLDLNPGDVPYRYRYRRPLPDSILATQPEGLHWVIVGAGRSKYRFELRNQTNVEPNPSLKKIAIADNTPELIRFYKLTDEQALLAILRYNRLLDTFLGITTYSLQNHLRTQVDGIGQIEIDELYMGVDKHGCHFVIPVQAKSGKDKIGFVQTSQDLAFCDERYPKLQARAVSAQFMDDGTIALFLLEIDDGDLCVAEERHYRLVPAEELREKDLSAYSA